MAGPLYESREMMKDFKPGDRVEIKGDWNWPNDCRGVITDPPEYARQLVADQEPWQGFIRTVNGRKSPITFLWVTFDEPQLDGDGDGPYTGGEVDASLVTKVREV